MPPLPSLSTVRRLESDAKARFGLHSCLWGAMLDYDLLFDEVEEKGWRCPDSNVQIVQVFADAFKASKNDTWTNICFRIIAPGITGDINSVTACHPM